MAKRFTDTDKWKKKFLRGLQAPYKLLWLYILDECDHAGVWIVDFDVARLRLDEDVFEDEALKAFGDKIFKIDNGERWLILDFIEFQYGKLKETNNAHISVIKTLKKYGIWYEDKLVVEELISPSQGAKDMDKEKDKDKDKEKEGGEKKLNPPTIEDFKTYFEANGYSKDLAERAWKGYSEADWKDSKGNKVKNWKQKCQHVWFKPENKNERTATTKQSFTGNAPAIASTPGKL
jgi:hypothetical protein